MLSIILDNDLSDFNFYYSDLKNAIQKISRLGLANQKEEFILAGFIESFNSIKNKLTNSIKN